MAAWVCVSGPSKHPNPCIPVLFHGHDCVTLCAHSLPAPPTLSSSRRLLSPCHSPSLGLKWEAPGLEGQKAASYAFYTMHCFRFAGRSGFGFFFVCSFSLKDQEDWVDKVWEEAEGELGQEGMNLWFSNRGRRIFYYEDQGGESKQARSCTSPAKAHSLLKPTTASTDNTLSMTLASGVSAHREGGGLLWEWPLSQRHWQGSLESSQSDSCGGHITPVTWILVHTF